MLGSPRSLDAGRLEAKGAEEAFEEGTKHTAERVAMYLAGPWLR